MNWTKFRFIPALILVLCLSAAASCSSGTSPDARDGNESGDHTPAATKGATGEEGEAASGGRSLEALIFPRSPAPGDFTLLAVGPCSAGTEIKLETELPVSLSPPCRAGEYTYFILGLSLQARPGEHNLKVHLDGPGGETAALDATLAVADRNFGTVSFTVPAERTSGWTAERLAEDRARVRRARLETESYPLWHQPFIVPLEGRISSGFGEVRIINRGAPSRHGGIDIPAMTGTPVAAMNDGVVRLAASLLAYGNIVIIDHGLDLSSSYLHLSAVAVEEGQEVSRGEVIGYVGDTGYSTGPHLHWEVNLGLLPLNPLQLTGEDMIYLPTPAAAR